MCIVKVYTADYALLPEDDFQHIKIIETIDFTFLSQINKTSKRYAFVWRNIFLIISIHFGTCTPFQAFLRLFVPYFITLHTILLYCALVNNSVHWCEYSNGNKTQLSI